MDIKAGDGPGGGDVIIDGATIVGGDTILMSSKALLKLCDKWEFSDDAAVCAEDLRALIAETIK